MTDQIEVTKEMIEAGRKLDVIAVNKKTGELLCAQVLPDSIAAIYLAMREKDPEFKRLETIEADWEADQWNRHLSERLGASQEG